MLLLLLTCCGPAGMGIPGWMWWPRGAPDEWPGTEPGKGGATGPEEVDGAEGFRRWVIWARLADFLGSTGGGLALLRTGTETRQETRGNMVLSESQPTVSESQLTQSCLSVSHS